MLGGIEPTHGDPFRRRMAAKPLEWADCVNYKFLIEKSF